MALVCRVELNQTTGITLTVANKDGNITQTATFDGTAITLTCKGQQDTSTITQTSDSITVACKNFTVNAESITCKSTKDTQHQAQGTFTMDSTGKASFSSSADMDVKASSKLNMSSADFASSAQNSAKLTAGSSMDIEGTTTTVKGATTNLQGTTTTVKGTITNVEGTTTTVKGDITNIQGSLVKLG